MLNKTKSYTLEIPDRVSKLEKEILRLDMEINKLPDYEDEVKNALSIYKMQQKIDGMQEVINEITKETSKIEFYIKNLNDITKLQKYIGKYFRIQSYCSREKCLAKVISIDKDGVECCALIGDKVFQIEHYADLFNRAGTEEVSEEEYQSEFKKRAKERGIE